MILQKIELDGFRNYRHLSLECSAGVNVLSGENAQGKTNFLEALYLLACGKSFRVSSERELLCWGEEVFAIQAGFLCDSGRERELTVRCGGGAKEKWERRVVIDGRLAARYAELLSVMPAALFVPQDLALVQGGPADRRRYLNVLCCKLDLEYCQALSRFGRIVRERNALLRSGLASAVEFEVWEQQLAACAEVMEVRRRAVVQRLGVCVGDIFRRLSAEKGAITLRLRSNCGATAQETVELLARNREAERARGVSVVGPHHDDLVISLDGLNLRRVGSQGQHRSVALALRLGEASLLGEALGERPIVLLDDCFSELDRGRCGRLFAELANMGQVFITSVDSFDYSQLLPDSLGEMRSYRVKAGNITLEQD